MYIANGTDEEQLDMFIANCMDEERLDWMGQPCWFCGQRAPVRGKSCAVKMKKITGATDRTISWLHCAVSVPRCAECCAGHHRSTSIAMSAVFGGALALFLIFVVWSPIDMPGWVKALLVFGGMLPGCALLRGTIGLPHGQKPESAADGFMAVEELKRGGRWIKDG